MQDNVTFKKFSDVMSSVYRKVNDRNYSNTDLVSKIQRYATIATKGVRKDKPDLVGPNLAMSLAWTVSLANSLWITIDDPDGCSELWCRFPGVCPYCGEVPCKCVERRAQRIEGTPELDGLRNSEHMHSLHFYQDMFSQIYPNNDLVGSCLHLHEEIIELMEAVKVFGQTHAAVAFESIKEELIDVIANIFAVASTAKIDMGREISKLFPYDTCCECHEPRCKCGFTIAKPIPPPLAVK